MPADFLLQMTIGAALFAAAGAVLLMMFHGRQILPDSVREEFRESLRKNDRRFAEIFGTRQVRWLLVFLVVLTIGLAMTREEFWKSSWLVRSRLAFLQPASIVLVVVLVTRLRRV